MALNKTSVGSAGVVTLAGVIIMQALNMLNSPDIESQLIAAAIIIIVFVAAMWRESVKPQNEKND